MIICSKIWGARPPRFPLASTMDKTDRGESFYKRIGLADHNRYVRRQWAVIRVTLWCNQVMTAAQQNW